MNEQIFRYEIDPVGKVRQTQSDRFRKRPCVVRYRMFADWLRENGCTLEAGDSVTFIISMPMSWSDKKWQKHDGTHHTGKPDLDNLLGGLMDAVCPDGDGHLSHFGSIEKRWGEQGLIIIRRPNRADQPELTSP